MPRSTPEEKAAIEMAQALLGSMAQQPPDLPPPVQATPPPPAAAQQAQPAAQVPRDNVDEIKDDPPPSATSEQKAQSTDAVPPRHRLLQRLLRALPIASPAQLTAMINVFDPNRDVLLAPPPATTPRHRPFPKSWNCDYPTSILPRRAATYRSADIGPSPPLTCPTVT